jgi:serine/alanine adding enzyme
MIKIITDPDKIDRKAWSEFVSDHPDGNIFQTPEMFHVYKNTKNYTPVFVALLEDNAPVACLLGVLQKEYSGFLGAFTARSIIFGGPLASGNNPEYIKLILSEYKKSVSAAAIFTQIRNMAYQTAIYGAFSHSGFAFQDHLNIILDLSIGEEKLWAGLSRSRKKGIKKATAANFKFDMCQNQSMIDSFYTLLALSYKRIKLPYPDKLHFLLLTEHLKSDMFKIFTIGYDDKIVASLFALSYKETMYGYYMGATDDPEMLKQKPVDLLFWEVFKWGMQHNFRYFDWMGAGKPDKDYGVRDFKLQYGGSAINMGRFEKIHKPIVFRISKIALKIWQITRK